MVNSHFKHTQIYPNVNVHDQLGEILMVKSHSRAFTIFNGTKFLLKGTKTHLGPHVFLTERNYVLVINLG